MNEMPSRSQGTQDEEGCRHLHNKNPSLKQLPSVFWESSHLNRHPMGANFPLASGCRFRVEHRRSTGLQGKTYEQGVKETRDSVPFFDFPITCRVLNIVIQCIKSEKMT